MRYSIVVLMLLSLSLLWSARPACAGDSTAVDELFARHAARDPEMNDHRLVVEVLRCARLGLIAGDGLWKADDLKQWQRIAPIAKRLMASPESPAGMTGTLSEWTLSGPDPLGAEAVRLRRELITRAVRGVVAYHAAKPAQIRDEHVLWSRWYAVTSSLGLDQGAEALHWARCEDRDWARHLIPDLVTALERRAALTPPFDESFLGLACWCAAYGPVGLHPRCRVLASRFKDPAHCLSLLTVVPGPAAPRLTALAAVNDLSVSTLAKNPWIRWDESLCKVLLPKITTYPLFLSSMGFFISSLPLNAELCARMIADGTTGILSPDTNSSGGIDHEARLLWLEMAMRHPAVRGCLSPPERARLQATCKAAASPVVQARLFGVRVAEEPDQKRRVEVIGHWLQAAVASGDDIRQPQGLIQDLQMMLWVERSPLPASVLALLQTQPMAKVSDGDYLQRILVRNGVAPPPRRNREAGSTLLDVVAYAFSVDDTPAKIVEWLEAQPTQNEHEVAAIARWLPAGAGLPWATRVEQAFVVWWQNPERPGRPRESTAPLAIGLWAAASGLVTPALAWALRADLQDLRRPSRMAEHDGSLIHVLVDHQGVRARIWVAEQRWMRRSTLSLIDWLADGHAGPLPVTAQLVGNEIWPQILRQVVPRGAAGLEMITPLLDVRTVLSDELKGHGPVWGILKERLDP